MLDICCIGHITLDKIVTPTQEVYMPGGTSYYFSYGINSLFQSEVASGCDNTSPTNSSPRLPRAK